MADEAPAPGWYADPAGAHEHRYWGGGAWTEHVASHGRQGTDPLVHGGAVPTVRRSPDRVERDVQKAGGASAPAGTGLFDQPVLVVSQKAKLLELNNEYAVFDQHGTQVGAVRQVGQSALKKAVRLLSSYDQFMTHKLQVVDGAGHVQLAITRPAKLLKSRVEIADASGQLLGQVRQLNAVGKIRFAIEAPDGSVLGAVNGENWRAWNFSVRDRGDVEIARITKTWEGLAKTMFTTADNYVVHIHRPLEPQMRPLVVAAALCVDTALKQDARGLG